MKVVPRVPRFWAVLLSMLLMAALPPVTPALAAGEKVEINFSGASEFVVGAVGNLSATVSVGDVGDLSPTTPLRLAGTLVQDGAPAGDTILNYAGPGGAGQVTTAADGTFTLPTGEPWTLATVPALQTAAGVKITLGVTLPAGKTQVGLQLVATAPSSVVDRVSGTTRVETAAKISAANFPAGIDVAYVARADKFPDALAGGPAAALDGAPVLLTTSTSLPDATAAELTRLAPERIVVLGGTASVSDEVATELAAFAGATEDPVLRFGGRDRVDTARVIAENRWPDGAGTVYVATAANFPDALSGAAAAAATGAPILLTGATALPEPTLAALTALQPERVVVLGGTAVVGEAVEQQLAAFAGVSTVDRLKGSDRYGTSAAISADVFGTDLADALVATGANFPDALAGGAAAADLGAPLLLVESDAVPAVIADELARTGAGRATILGGIGVVKAGVSEQLSTILGGPVTPVGDPADVTITPTAPGGTNTPPVVAAIADQTSTAGKSATLQVTASDPDSGDTITYSATGLPAGLTINANTGVIAGTIAKGADAESPYAVTVTVTDSKGATKSASFSWKVQTAIVLPVGFGSSGLGGASSINPTSLEWGPDERLYVAQQDGMILAYTVERGTANDYTVTGVEQIDEIQQIVNHDDDGTVVDTEGRQVTGLMTAGTAQSPVLYVSSSDPRINEPGEHQPLDTNSGVISKLTKNGSSWEHVQLVRGLSRSYENHSTNGMDLDEATGTLYVMQGGHANMGGPSANFGYVPEYAYSAALLSVDLSAIEAMPTKTVDTDGDGTAQSKVKLDLPTLADTGQPFGGQAGANMAIVEEGSPVQVHSPGYRNAYDVVVTTKGRLYTVDNGPNWGWGDVPAGNGTNACTNEPNGSGATQHPDGLHFISGKGYYAGHPNPTRGNPAGAGLWTEPDAQGSSTMYASVAHAVPTANPVECTYKSPADPVEDGNLHTWTASTNGLAEYTASNFGSAMQGDLVVASFDGRIYRVQLNAAGTQATVTPIAEGFGSTPLDVTALGDSGPFPGTLWAATYGSNAVTVLEPADYGGTVVECDLSVPDADGDGYGNAEEVASGTDPCNGASKPADFDGDNVGDMTDTDDDNDGRADVADVFPRDAGNGLDRMVPDSCPTFSGAQPESSPGCLQFENGAFPGTVLDLGFTGVMLPATFDTSYESLYTATDWIAGGAANIASLKQTEAGDAWSTGNDQKDAVQFGIRSSGKPFTVQTRVQTPFDHGVPSDYQAIGMQVGDGTQENYVKFVVTAAGGGGGLQLATEEDDVNTGDVAVTEPGVVGNVNVILALDIDPGTGAVAARYSLDEGATFEPAGSLYVPTAWFGNPAQGFAVGLLATHNPSTNLPIQADWTYLTVQQSTATPPPQGGAGAATLGVLAGTDEINSSTYDDGAFEVTNTGGSAITSVTYDLSTALLPDLVFDPEGTAGDLTAKDMVVDGGKAVTGQTTHAFSKPDNGRDGADGYAALTVDFTDFGPGETFSFSIDNDPTSVKGAAAPGPNEAGSVSGLELAGTKVTVAFADGTTATGSIFGDGTDGGAGATVKAGLPAAPTLTRDGSQAAATVTTSSQSVTVTAPPGTTVALLDVEAGLFLPTDGSYAGTGYDVDPYEANSALEQAVTETTTDASGIATFELTLGASHADGGMHRLMAVAVGSGDVTGATSDVLAIDYAPPGGN